MAALALRVEVAAKVAGNLSSNLPWELANNKWAGTLNPLLANPIVNGSLLKNISVTTGANSIAHGLQRKLQGYIVVLNSANVTFYDTQATNQMPDIYLVLHASGAATISLYVF